MKRALLALLLVLTPCAAEAAPSAANPIAGSTSTAPLVLTWPGGAPATGTVEVACVIGQAHSTAVAPTTTSLWSTDVVDATNYGVGCFHHIATASEPTTVSFANGTAFNMSAAMVEVTGAVTTAPQFSDVLSATTATLSTSSITPATTGSVALAFFSAAQGSSNVTFTTNASWTTGATTASIYGDFIEYLTALTTTSPVSVSSTMTSGLSFYYAYEYIVAPASGSKNAIGNCNSGLIPIGNGKASAIGNGVSCPVGGN